jgi:hypothetical protein
MMLSEPPVTSPTRVHSNNNTTSSDSKKVSKVVIAWCIGGSFVGACLIAWQLYKWDENARKEMYDWRMRQVLPDFDIEDQTNHETSTGVLLEHPTVESDNGNNDFVTVERSDVQQEKTADISDNLRLVANISGCGSGEGAEEDVYDSDDDSEDDDSDDDSEDDDSDDIVANDFDNGEEFGNDERKGTNEKEVGVVIEDTSYSHDRHNFSYDGVYHTDDLTHGFCGEEEEGWEGANSYGYQYSHCDTASYFMNEGNNGVREATPVGGVAGEMEGLAPAIGNQGFCCGEDYDYYTASIADKDWEGRGEIEGQRYAIGVNYYRCTADNYGNNVVYGEWDPTRL